MNRYYICPGVRNSVHFYAGGHEKGTLCLQFFVFTGIVYYNVFVLLMNVSLCCVSSVYSVLFCVIGCKEFPQNDLLLS